MYTKLVKSLKSLYNFRKLSIAEDDLNERKYSEALLMLNKIKWDPLSIDVSLMKAEALMGLKKNKEAVLELAYSNELIALLPDTAPRKTYFELYNLCLIEKASGHKLPERKLIKQYESIDFTRVPDRIKRQFPLSMKIEQA